MNEREKLELELNAMKKSKCFDVSDMVAFVLEDRNSLIEPLREIYPKLQANVNDEICFICLKAIEETFEKSGAFDDE